MLITEKIMENGLSHQTSERRMNLIKLGAYDDNKSIKHVKKKRFTENKKIRTYVIRKNNRFVLSI